MDTFIPSQDRGEDRRVVILRAAVAGSKKLVSDAGAVRPLEAANRKLLVEAEKTLRVL